MPRTAFSTPFGHHKFKVLSFGYAPATFRAVRNDIFRLYTGKFVLVYLDDIFGFSKSPLEQAEHLRLVLQRLHDLHARCTFNQPELEYLALIVGSEEI